MPIHSLTQVSPQFIKLGSIKKGEKDEKGVPHDLSYFRVVFMPGKQKDAIEAAFRAAYGLQPTEINVRFGQPNVSDIWDANFECYKKGGLIAKAGENESGPYWVFYRDPETSEVLVRNGSPVGAEGLDFFAKPIDLTKPIYLNSKNEGVYLEPYGRLQVVVPEVSHLAVGYFEFTPGSPRDIRNISSELGAFDAIAKQYGKSICGVPFKLIRREEEVTVNIDGKLSKKKSWVVHLDAGGEWGSKAIEMIERLALPEIIDAVVEEVPEEPEEFPERVNVPIQVPPEEMIDPLSARSVKWVMDQWSCPEAYARKEIAKIGFPNPVAKSVFKKTILEGKKK